MDNMERRVFLKGAALSALTFTLGAGQALLTPREAYAQAIPLHTLNPDERLALEALSDTLLPGATEAGIAHYIDQQISADPKDCLLTVRSIGVPPPYADFYRGGLAALDQASRKLYGVAFPALPSEKRNAFVEQMRQKNPDGWNGPPAPFFYFITRNDALDVYYGTVEGFERLGVPYMPHILPERNW